MRPSTRFVLTAAGLVLAVAGAACSPAPQAPVAPTDAAADAGQAAPAGEVRAMEPDRKRAELGAGFPAEVPVPDGTVLRGRAQGADAWDYELEVGARPEAVAQWYYDTLTSRSWQLAGERELEGGGIELSLVKGVAQTRVVITAEGGGSRVVGVLGLGPEVLQTQ